MKFYSFNHHQKNSLTPQSVLMLSGFSSLHGYGCTRGCYKFISLHSGQYSKTPIFCFFGGPHKNGVKSGKHFAYALLTRTIQKVCKIVETQKCQNVKLVFYCSWNLNSSITEGKQKWKKSCNDISTCTWMHAIYSSLTMLQYSLFHEWLLSSHMYVSGG